jgi:4-hydroxythreonine-4-phosphate dehydrogenase
VPALPAEPRRPRIALTAGEPAGVGPELVAQVLAEDFRADLVVIASRQLLIERALAAGTLPGSDGNAACGFECVDIALSAPSLAGKLDARNARYVLACLDRAAEGAHSGEFDAIVTAPVHKGIINDAGIPFSGHTEWLADTTATPRVAMIAHAGRTAGHDSTTGRWLRVALATTHLPPGLRCRPPSPARIAWRTTHAHPRIAALRMPLRPRANPASLVAWAQSRTPVKADHLGSRGDRRRSRQCPRRSCVPKACASGSARCPRTPLFVPRQLADIRRRAGDVPRPGPARAQARDLRPRRQRHAWACPIIRTSVDHGTALDLAGTWHRADAGSLRSAIRLAVQLARRRNA